MGFLSGLTQNLFGGSNSSSGQQSTSGFSLLPPEIQGAFKNYGTAVNAQIPNATSAYTPLPQTADETSAFNTIRQGFTPTADSLNSDVSMLMNPYDNFVKNDINRQAGSDFSILKQNLDQAGQFGSNRQQLGANDIEQTRLNTIGTLDQSQYNQAISQIFNNLIPTRQADAQGLLGIGNFQRNLNTQTNTAPITGLQQIGAALGILPSTGGSQSTGTSESQSNNGIFKSIGL